MVSKRTVARASVARQVEVADAPKVEPVFDVTEAPVEGAELTLSDVAFRLDMHRVSILRLEQRKKIPPARWRKRPNPHRVYSEAEFEIIKAYVDQEKSKRNAGRHFIEDHPNAQ